MASEKKALEGKSVVYDKCGASAGYESDMGSRRDALLAYLTGRGQYFRVGGSGSVQGMVQCVQDLSAAQCQDCLSEAAQRLKTECATSPGGICSWEKERLVSRDGNALSSLFLPDDSQDDLFRKIEEGWGPISEEIDIRELKDEGPEVRSGDLPQPITLESGQEFTFTIRRGVGTADCVSVNYDDFVNDVEVGDMLLVDVGSCLQLTF